jgi:branched-subunit amino acid transport protein
VSTTWAAVIVIGAATIAIKAAGPVLAGGRGLPDRLARVVELLAPAVLAALVVTQTVGGDEELVIDERLAGVGVAAVAIALKAPILVSVTIAAVVTALLRLAT